MTWSLKFRLKRSLRLKPKSLRLRACYSPPMFRDLAPSAVIFFGIFGISLCIQHVAWVLHNDVVDQYIWSKAVVQISANMLFQPEVGPEIVNSAYGYPGATIIIPSALLIRYGATPFKALQDVL